MNAQGVGTLTQDSLIEDGQDNDIVEITVFSNRGLVKRKIVANAKPGLNRFAVQTKAFNIDAESAQARVFGEVKKKASPLQRFLRMNKIGVLKPSLNTEPKVYYANLDVEVN